jgi:hypothetical protein
MILFRRLLRCGLFFLAAILLWAFSDTLLWVPCLILGLFFAAVDLRGIDKSPRKPLDMEAERSDHAFGVLGKYVVDSDESYGLFLKLHDWTVFVDVKEDKLLAKRKEYAMRLVQSKSELERNLKKFIDENPDYRGRRPTYVGLHSDSAEHAEVFWEPEGHSLLRDTSFIEK